VNHVMSLTRKPGMVSFPSSSYVHEAHPVRVLTKSPTGELSW